MSYAIERKLLRLSMTINLQNMKEDNNNQLCDYDAPFGEQQHTQESCYISLSKSKSFDQINIPQTVSDFRHLLSCDTILYRVLIASLIES